MSGMNMGFLLKFVGFALLIAVVLYGLSLFSLWTQLARYKNYWDRNNQKPAISGELLYVALGDSTAQGIGASHPDKSYPGVIAKQLAQRENRPVRLVNLSKSGAKVRDVIDTQLPAFEKLDSKTQAKITIEIGANNIIGFNAESFEKDMDELMGKLPKQTIVSDIPYFGGGRLKSREPDVQKANEIMYRLADKHGFELAKLHEQTRRNDSIKTFATDWFHPSSNGYKVNWAPVFLDRL